MTDTISFSRLALWPLKLVAVGLLMVIDVTASNSVWASSPIPFFRGVDVILIQVGVNPFGQVAFDEAEIAQSARTTVENGFHDMEPLISVEVVGPNNAKLLAPRTLSVLIHISVRDAQKSLGSGRTILLASSITLVRGDLKVPESIPPFFLAPPEPIIVTSDKQDMQRRLNEAISRQLQAAVIKPVIDSSSRRR